MTCVIELVDGFEGELLRDRDVYMKIKHDQIRIMLKENLKFIED